MKLKTVATAVLAAAALVNSARAQAILSSVAVYDAPTNPNVVDLTNVIGLTYPIFTGALPGAWAGNTGGVCNFDQPQLLFPAFPAMAQANATVRYGAAFTKALLLTFSQPASIALPLGGAVPISGNGVLQVPPNLPGGVPFGIKLNPSNGVPIRRVGLTIPQQVNPQTIRVQWIQGGGAPPLAAAQVIPVAPVPTRDVCFAAQATTPAGIIGLQIWVSHGLTGAPIAFNIDDIGFQQ